MPSAFSRPMLVPSALRAPAPVNLGVRHTSITRQPMIDHYSTLGVVPSADPAVIKAAYRALAAIYHPDKNSSPDASEFIKAINIAYETLSNPEKRRQYDSVYGASTSAKPSEFEDAAHFTDEQIESSWGTATKFHPTIALDFAKLGKISWRLAFSFKLKLIEEKAFLESHAIAEEFKKTYLSRFFGSDPQNQKLAEELLKSREIQAAIRLNEIVSVVGSSVSPQEIQRQVFSEHKTAEVKFRKRQHYAALEGNSYYGLDPYQAELLVKMHGGAVTRSGFFRRKVLLELNGGCMSFGSENEFVLYVKKIYETEYS
ncbi:DnaJ-like protein [Aquabacterium commune]|uniref:DnaJ-like protein n=2 Tax=Aquabacterium commune TaxID=70586 RepID=A0A4R6QY98_9BURK|nr:DnaJ-like protein [Aquabacterium commune]